MNPASNHAATDGQPLVSIIVRTMNRPELAEALRSIALQTHAPLEVVVVDALGQGLDPALLADPAYSLRLVSTGKPLGRSRAANAGLEQSTGAYLMFLDDDDWIGEDHIARLMERLQSSGVQAAYSSVAKVSIDGLPTGEVFDRDYDPVLLRRDNYIPIHAVLFSQSLVQQGCRFDEALDVYEDWDFWLQVSRLTDFAHVAAVTAFYRQGGASATATDDLRTRFTPGHPLARAREHLLDKWRQVWSGREINELLGIMDDTELQLALRKDIARAESRIGELDTELRRQLEVNADQLKINTEQLKVNAEQLKVGWERQQTIYHLHTAMDNLRQGLENQINALRTEVEAGLARDRDARQTQWHLQRHIEELQTRIDTIYASPSWRIMGPFRRLSRFASQRLVFPLKAAVHFRRYGTRLQPPWPAVGAKTADLAPSASPQPAPPPADQESLKTRYRLRAEQHLQDFLQHSPGISFPAVESPRVSILLVLYNQAPLTLLCLESILQYAPYPYEVVVIDNASADDSAAMMAKVHNVTLVRNEDNVGFVRAVNQGARLCRGQYTLLLNNDALLHGGSIEAALGTLEQTPRAGAVGGRILLLDGALQEAGSFIFSDGSCLGYGRHQDPEAPEYMFRRPVDYCSGAFLLYSSALFREMGGFDDDYAPAYYEDSDFCVRLQEAGLQVIYEPRAVITHYEFASSGGQTKASELQTRHRAVLCRKHADYLARRVAPHPDNLLRARSANDHINVLMIDDRVPHAGLGAGFPRSKQIATLLANAEVNLTFYPLQFPEDDWGTVYETLPATVEVMLNLGRDGLAGFLAARRDFYDVILVSRVHNMEVLSGILHQDPNLLGRSRLVYDAEAVTAPRTILQRELRGEAVSEDTRQRLLREELGMSVLADTVIAVTAAESRLYHEQGVARTVVLGHSLQPRPTQRPFHERRNLLFVGALNVEHSPNVDSLLWFAVEVMPRLREIIPDLELLVVGDNTARSLAAITTPGIRFLGRIESITPYYDSCRVFIAPTRFAAGIPHKVHEAAAMGIPCVTTRLLARQLQWQHDEELLSADSGEEFLAACLDLYQDETRWSRVRQGGLAAVARDCAPDRFAADLLGIFGLSNTAAG